MAKKGLGKGVNALFKNMSAEDISGNSTAAEKNPENKIAEINLNEIEPNKNQPRKNFDPEKLSLLAESIKEHGVIQPIVLNKISDGRYMIVAGERRWRAAELAGLDTIKAVVNEYSMETVSELALIENLQREDLNPVEEAEGYRTLIEKYNFTQEKISRRIGKSRSAIANSLRLLKLEDEFRAGLEAGEITEGHARALLSLDGFEKRKALFDRIVSEDLNVRQTEMIIKRIKEAKEEKPPKPQTQLSAEIEKISERISASLGTRVSISHGKKKGRIEIEYYGNDDLERIINILTG